MELQRLEERYNVCLCDDNHSKISTYKTEGLCNVTESIIVCQLHCQISYCISCICRHSFFHMLSFLVGSVLLVRTMKSKELLSRLRRRLTSCVLKSSKEFRDADTGMITFLHCDVTK